MIASLFCASISLGLAQVQGVLHGELPGLDGGQSILSYSTSTDRLKEPRKSPLHKDWEFDWVIAGYYLGERKIHVYSQQRKLIGDLAIPVTRLLLRLIELNSNQMAVSQSSKYGNPRDLDKTHGEVEVYLAWGGNPGGEQAFTYDEDKDGVRFQVNGIYIYDLASFKGPIEMVREVAHEYGHATLTSAFGFKSPEYQSNGYLGEKLYLRWLRDMLSEKKIRSEDTMDASLPDLDAWVKANVDTLSDKVALNGPNLGLLNSMKQGAMDEYIGTILWFESLFGSMKTGSAFRSFASKPADIVYGMLVRMAESDSITLNIPKRLLGKQIWIPLGKGKVTGATVIKKLGDMALIKPTKGPIKVLPVEPDEIKQ